MKKVIFSICFCIAVQQLVAQKFNSAVEYLEFVGERTKRIQKESWDYSKSVARSKSARKIDKNRQNLIISIGDALRKNKIAKAYGAEDGVVFKKSVIGYLDVLKKVFQEDYAEILDMEQIADQSYDLMEAYMLAKEEASKVQEIAYKDMEIAYDNYAETNSIRLVEGKDSKLSKKLKNSNDVFGYYNEVYLIFFKIHKENAYFMEALNSKNLVGMEQFRRSILSLVEECQQKLDTEIKSFRSDGSLKLSCIDIVRYYKGLASNEYKQLAAFFNEKKSFDEDKSKFDAIKPSKRTQKDIDTYNNAIDAFNEKNSKQNQIYNKLNEVGERKLKSWNEKQNSFFNRHI